MIVVDADAHVEECEAHWSFLDGAYHKRRPLAVTFEHLDTYFGRQNAVWIIDGEINPKLGGRGAYINFSPVTSAIAHDKPYSIGAQTMEDMAARLADMDKYGIDYQVVMPSVFLFPLTEDPDFLNALACSYNRFMAQACEQGKGRVFFGAVLPVREIRHAVEAAREAKEMGAVAAFMAGGKAWDKSAGSSYLDPLYEELCRLDMPFVLHFGSWSPQDMAAQYGIIDTRFNTLMLSAVGGLNSMMAHGVFERFPSLRVAVLEVGSMWVPYVMHQVKRLYENGLLPAMRRPPEEYARAGNIYVAVENDEDIPYVAQWIGEDHLVMASDYPHWDASAEEYMAKSLDRAKIPAALKEKILCHNPKRLYNLPI